MKISLHPDQIKILVQTTLRLLHNRVQEAFCVDRRLYAKQDQEKLNSRLYQIPT